MSDKVAATVKGHGLEHILQRERRLSRVAGVRTRLVSSFEERVNAIGNEAGTHNIVCRYGNRPPALFSHDFDRTIKVVESQALDPQSLVDYCLV